MTSYYPAFLDLRQRRCVVVGGGEVARQKVFSLMPCGADVTVIAPEVHPSIQRLAQRGAVRWSARSYGDGDLIEAFLVVAATDDPVTNSAVHAEARRRGALCNVVDVPDQCDFIAPAVMRRGPLLAALSTGGASPAFASRLKRELARIWGPEYGQIVLAMRAMRPVVRGRLPDIARRKAYWLAVSSREDLPALCRQGGRRAVVDDLLAQLVEAAD
ncbi:MAG TPA: bifunctional precorrin-2 dehydrogenase/sirohydrochlorin ferrochelatase [Bacillota bacterium]|nr:bifunctional precorrin-2 dehydrogenase/sirohydrochlorin ferrochelatase [Bacillota bacterium]